MSLASTNEVMERKVSVTECAEYLRVSKPTIHRMIHRGELVAYRVGRDFRIPMSSLREFVGDSMVDPQGVSW